MHLSANNIPSKLLAAISYSGKKIEIVPKPRVTIIGNTQRWDSGSRTEWFAADLEKLEVKPIGIPTTARWPEPVPDRSFDLKPNFCVIEHRTVRGKDFGLVFHVHPDNMPARIEEEKLLTREEEIVLIATRSYKPSYGGVSNYRYQEAHRETGIHMRDWEKAKATLISKGLLNRAGAITIEGKNAIGRRQLSEFRSDE